MNASDSVLDLSAQAEGFTIAGGAGIDTIKGGKGDDEYRPHSHILERDVRIAAALRLSFCRHSLHTPTDSRATSSVGTQSRV